MAIAPGATATNKFTVTDDDTAIALGSGDVPVLGTPRLVAWCEAVTVMALARDLAAGSTTVGYKIRMDHLAPTPVGAEVEVSATVVGVDGPRVALEVEAADGNGAVASGTVTRVVVDREGFLVGVNRRG